MCALGGLWSSLNYKEPSLIYTRGRVYITVSVTIPVHVCDQQG